jgi:hypothetical protein
MSEISTEEMRERVPLLLEKVARYRPRQVCPESARSRVNVTDWSSLRRVLAFVGMKICEIVLRHLHNLPFRDTEQSASSSPSKKRRPAMPKVKIGLQPAVITYPPEDTKDGRRQTTYIWCLPSSSARVVEYQVGPGRARPSSQRETERWLARHLQLVDKIEIWKDLKRDIGLLSSGQSPLKSAEIAFAEYPIEAVLPPAREEITSPHFKVTPIKREDVGMSALGR